MIYTCFFNCKKMSENQITFSTSMINELITKLQSGNLPAALQQVYLSEGMARINAIQNKIKTLEMQKNILNDQIIKLGAELNELISSAAVSD